MWGFGLRRVCNFYLSQPKNKKGVNIESSHPFIIGTCTEKLRLYMVTKKWWLPAESNHRHKDFQSSALPTELGSHHISR